MNYTIFGESHGNAIGVTLTGVPSGIEIDMNALRFEMSRRATGKNKLSTARKEADEILTTARTKAGEAVADLQTDKGRVQGEIDMLKSAAREYRARFLRLVEDQTHVINSESELFREDD